MGWPECVFWFCLVCVWFKTVIGYRFPWEVCICCGKKVGDHNE
jgi:hypothetical protein